jgi:hypothetical protein
MDGRGAEAGNLDGVQACGDQGEDGSVAQSNGSAGAHPAGIDARKKGMGLCGIEMHQTGSCWLSIVLLRSFESTLHQEAQDLQNRVLIEIVVSCSF